MLFKCLGSMLIFIAAAGLGWRWNCERERTVVELLQLEQAVAMLKSGITYEGVCLPELIKGISDSMDGEVSRLFFRFYMQLEKKNGTSLTDIWKGECRNFGNRMQLPVLVTEALAKPGDSLGKGDRQLQVHALEQAGMTVADYRRGRMEKREGEKKTCYALSMAGAAMMVLLLV